MAIDFGPASGNGSLFLGQTAGVEVHVGNPSSALNPEPPVLQVAPVDPGTSTTLTKQTNLSLNLGGAGIQFLNPA